MKNYNPPAFTAALNKTEIMPVIFLYGPETFFHDELLIKIEQKIFTNNAEKDFNFEVFYGPESNHLQLLNSCSAFPMMAKHRLVIVKQFEKLKIDNKDTFLEYIKKPQLSTVLVLSAENIPKNKFYQEIIANTVSVNCKHLNETGVFHWVKSRFSENRIEISNDALSYLIQNTGLDLIRLKIEIEKISDYIKPQHNINIDQISEITGFSKEYDVFTLQKTLSKRNLRNSLKTGLSLLERGTHLSAIMPVLYLFFNKLWIAKHLKNKGMSNNTILREVSGQEFQWRDAFNAIEFYAVIDIINIMEYLLEAEIQLKTSQKSEKSILSLLLFHICSK